MKAGFGKYKYLLHRGGTLNGVNGASSRKLLNYNGQKISKTDHEYESA
jgi:hypothetical protein